jgi:hypothetical protein
VEVTDCGNHKRGAYLNRTPCVKKDPEIAHCIQTYIDKGLFAYIVEERKTLLSRGQTAIEAIVAFLLTCDTTKDSGEIALVDLLREFNDVDPRPHLLQIFQSSSRAVAVHAHDAYVQAFSVSGSPCPYHVKGNCIAGGHSYSCSHNNPKNYNSCNVYVVNRL